MDDRIKWSPRAASHLDQICEFIFQDSETYARIFAKKILKIVEDIPIYPKSGRVVPEYENDNLRERIYENYRLVYRIKNDIIEIVAICHSSRPIEYSLENTQ